jgi:hypothetical protein
MKDKDYRQLKEGPPAQTGGVLVVRPLIDSSVSAINYKPLATRLDKTPHLDKRHLSLVSPSLPLLPWCYTATMSGLEVVGVVLGAIPIVVMAVEKYRRRKTRIAFRHKEVYVIRLIQSLRDQHYLLVSDIRLTLNGAGVNYDTLSTDRLPALFRDHNIAESVKDYLGSDSHVYFQAVDRCHSVLSALMRRIKGLESASVSWISAVN